MGWFTNRSKSWEFKNAVVLLGVVGAVSFLTLGLLTPIAVSIFGAIVKIGKWTKATLFIALVYLLFLIISLFAYLAGQSFISILALNFISFYIYVVYMSLDLGEYLQRLDLKNYIKLEKNKEYSYYEVMKQLNALNDSSSRKDVFIQNLEFYKKHIQNAKLLSDISELQRLVNIIVAKDEHRSDLFFERHGSTIENALKQYVELDTTYIKSSQVEESKHKIEVIIEKARIAFENELSKMIETEVLQVDAEAEVYTSILKGRGLL